MHQRSSIFPQICAAVAASLIFICAGFHQAWLNAFFSMRKTDESFRSMTISEIAWIYRFILIGIICALPFSVILVNVLGRRKTLLLTTVPFVISCVLDIFARNDWWLCAARFLAGLGTGAAFTVTPMYIGEIAEGRIRGSLSVLMFVMLYIGELIGFGIGPWVSRAAFAIVGAVIPIVFATALLWVPESPYYYAIKKAQNQTVISLTWLRGTPNVLPEVQEIRNSIALNQRNGGNFMKLLTASVIVFGLLTCKILVDTSLIHFIIAVYDFPIRFAFEFSTSAWVLVMLVSTIFIIPLVDVAGRRLVLLASTSLCVVFSLATALYLSLYEESTSWIVSVLMIGYSFSHSMGIGTIPLVVSGEIFPCEVKAFALGLSTAYPIVLEIGISYLGDVVVMSYGYLVSWCLLVGFNIASTVFIFFGVPETKGSSLSEIQTKLCGHFGIQM